MTDQIIKFFFKPSSTVLYKVVATIGYSAPYAEYSYVPSTPELSGYLFSPAPDNIRRHGGAYGHEPGTVRTPTFLPVPQFLEWNQEPAVISAMT